MAPPVGFFFLSLLDVRQGGEGREGKVSGGGGSRTSSWAHLFSTPVAFPPTPPCCPSPHKWRSLSSWINFTQWNPELGPLSSTVDTRLSMPPSPSHFISLNSPFHHLTYLILYYFLLPVSPQQTGSSHQTPQGWRFLRFAHCPISNT